MSDDIELRIARAEREYERVTSAVFAAKARVGLLSSDRTINELEVARARAQLQSLERKRTQLRQALDELDSASNPG